MKSGPGCVICLLWLLNVIDAGTTRLALSFRLFHFVVGESSERHCIWSSMLENAALSLSAFLISSALT